MLKHKFILHYKILKLENETTNTLTGLNEFKDSVCSLHKTTLLIIPLSIKTAVANLTFTDG